MSQESTRYCNYSNNKFGNEITFIKPCFWNEDKEEYKIWADTMVNIEKQYMKLIESGAHPQMREIANMIFEKFKNNIPILFDDIEIK